MKFHNTIAFKVIIRQNAVYDTLPDNKYVFLNEGEYIISRKKMKF